MSYKFSKPFLYIIPVRIIPRNKVSTVSGRAAELVFTLAPIFHSSLSGSSNLRY